MSEAMLGRIGLCPKFCRRCQYRSRGMNTCDYILIEGHSRGCPAGDGCIRFKEGAQKKPAAVTIVSPSVKQRRIGKQHLSAADDAMIRQLHSQGLSDGEIAKKIGCSKAAARGHRARMGLPVNPNPSVGGALFDAEHRRRLELHAQGLNDAQIGQAVGATPGAICSWRKRNSLPPNRHKRSVPE